MGNYTPYGYYSNGVLYATDSEAHEAEEAEEE